MSLHIPFDNTYARLPDGFFTPLPPEPVAAPRLAAWNQDLAALLQIEPGDVPEMAQVFAGNVVPQGAEPLAQLYSGHQFGQYNPQLGDGRAVLLGETIGTDGQRRDIQLKGSGRTPYSRMGDGRAWLGPVLREYVVSEAMHALGVPTTRALAVVETGQPVYREAQLPGAVLTRVAASHLRVGTFQIFAARGETGHLKRLTHYAIERHYPDADGPLGLFAAVCAAQAKLVAQWLSVGFIHGVMNTDNCTISGETIDYGPCAFMDTYHPDTVFSSIDQFGRYAYGNQPKIVVWNLAQLATALIQQMDDVQAAAEEATAILHAVPQQIEAGWLTLFGRKIGIEAASEADRVLITDLLDLMAAGQADFTNTFQGLAAGSARDQFLEPAAFDQWQVGWAERIAREADPKRVMIGSNPVIIPRNHRIEEMIQAAVDGAYGPFERLTSALSRPFEVSDQNKDLMRPPQSHEVVPATFCGT